MKKYEDLKMKICFYTNHDIIMSSADDFGGWNDEWFS